MSPHSRTRRLLAGLALAGMILFGSATVLAAPDNPDFYATIITADRAALRLVVSPTKDQLITIDVRELGSEPWDVGAFAPNNVVLIRTKRVGDALVATGWEQARDGRELFEGVEQPEKQRPPKEDDNVRPPKR